MAANLWPARNVAEYAYCPRLFYFMEVEGIHVSSDDTELGNHVHRNVDGPSLANSGDKPDKTKTNASESNEQPRVARSLTLSSERLGLTATLDLAELHGQQATPLEYRKGRPRHRALG